MTPNPRLDGTMKPEVVGPPPVDRPMAANTVPIRDRLLWGWDDIAALTGLSRRLLEREVSAGRMPPPDVRIGRRARYRPATITGWLDSRKWGNL
jgi:predicted DNA-binding transcriptional regulator AlpA